MDYYRRYEELPPSDLGRAETYSHFDSASFFSCDMAFEPFGSNIQHVHPVHQPSLLSPFSPTMQTNFDTYSPRRDNTLTLPLSIEHRYSLGLQHVNTEDIYEPPRIRNTSPTNTFSITDTSSEYATSPDMVKHSTTMVITSSPRTPCAYPSPSTGLTISPNHNWSTYSPLMHASTYLNYQVEYKEPGILDEDMEDLHTQEAVEIKVQPVAEPEIEVPSPGTALSDTVSSVDDNESIMKEEDDDDYNHDSGHDSDFKPGKRVVTKRPGPRSPRKGKTSARKNSMASQHGVKKTQPKAQGSKPSATAPKPKGRPAKEVVTTIKSFPCTFARYGCPSTFGSKNEWKRHVTSQHLKLGVYRCDMGSCTKDQARGIYNDFNRKDLFTQHCRRMHAPWVVDGIKEDKVTKSDRDNYETELETIRDRCWVVRRKAPTTSTCGICRKVFSESDNSTSSSARMNRLTEGRAWEERMEHVGRHYEQAGEQSIVEDVDPELQAWAITERIIDEGRVKGKYWLIDSEPGPADNTKSGEKLVGRRGRRRNPVASIKLDEEDTIIAVQPSPAQTPTNTASSADDHGEDCDAEGEEE